jgi:hypothetical protein
MAEPILDAPRVAADIGQGIPNDATVIKIEDDSVRQTPG